MQLSDLLLFVFVFDPSNETQLCENGKDFKCCNLYIKYNKILFQDAPEAKERYADKIKICGIDPYKVKTSVEDVPLNVTYADIFNFMVTEPNPFTGAPKDSVKGMQAHLYFRQGWVKHVSGKKLNDLFVVHGKVLHSFSVRDRPLKPWVIINDKGKVLAGHCDCAIGLLETCSHIGATLYSLDDLRQKIIDKKVNYELNRLCF